MNSEYLFALVGIGLVGIALHGLIIHAHLLRKILAINIMGTGVFLFLVALASNRENGTSPDSVCHAMVITGVVVAVSATALALCLMVKIHHISGDTRMTRE